MALGDANLGLLACFRETDVARQNGPALGVPFVLVAPTDLRMVMNQLLARSAELEEAISALLALGTFDGSARSTTSRTLCSVSLEHAESTKILLVSGNFTSAVGLIRLQYEALVRALWLLYAASDGAAEKLAAELSQRTETSAEKIPMLSEMLSSLEGKAPKEALEMLLEFKQYSWKPLSSFVHGGVHAIHRHSKGYPAALLDQALRASNGVSLMVGMLLVMLSGDQSQRGRVSGIQMKFRDCLPPDR